MGRVKSIGRLVLIAIVVLVCARSMAGWYATFLDAHPVPRVSGVLSTREKHRAEGVRAQVRHQTQRGGGGGGGGGGVPSRHPQDVKDANEGYAEELDIDEELARIGAERVEDDEEVDAEMLYEDDDDDVEKEEEQEEEEEEEEEEENDDEEEAEMEEMEAELKANEMVPLDQVTAADVGSNETERVKTLQEEMAAELKKAVNVEEETAAEGDRAEKAQEAEQNTAEKVQQEMSAEGNIAEKAEEAEQNTDEKVQQEMSAEGNIAEKAQEAEQNTAEKVQQEMSAERNRAENAQEAEQNTAEKVQQEMSDERNRAGNARKAERNEQTAPNLKQDTIEKLQKEVATKRDSEEKEDQNEHIGNDEVQREVPNKLVVAEEDKGKEGQTRDKIAPSEAEKPDKLPTAHGVSEASKGILSPDGNEGKTTLTRKTEAQQTLNKYGRPAGTRHSDAERQRSPSGQQFKRSDAVTTMSKTPTTNVTNDLQPGNKVGGNTTDYERLRKMAAEYRLTNRSSGPPTPPIGPDDMNYTLQVDPRRFQSFEDALSKMANRNKTVILSLVDATFVDFALNFYAISIRRLNLTNYLPVCVDQSSWNSLRGRGIACYLDSRFSLAGSDSAAGESDFGTSGYYNKTNVKTRVVREALGFGYSVLMVDLDVILFKDPFPYFTCAECDIHIQMDRSSWNSGFVYARPTAAARRLYKIAWEQYQKYHISHDQSYLNMAYDIMKLNNMTLRVQELPPALFPCGVYHFENDFRMFAHSRQPCKDCVMTHNNYIGSTAAKIYRFRENLMWLVDPDNYYSCPERKYLTYNNPIDFGEKMTPVMEKNALRNALAIGQLTNRTVILPSFRCCDCKTKRCDKPRHRCSLLNVLSVKNFDLVFRDLYREHVFLSSPQVAPSLSKSLSDILVVNSTLYQDPEFVKELGQNAKIFTPKNLTVGADQHEIEEWLAPYRDTSIVRFHSLYNAFSSFADRTEGIMFQRKILKGLDACPGYEQWEEKKKTHL